MKPAPPVIRNRKTPPNGDKNENYTATRALQAGIKNLELLNIVVAFAMVMLMMRTVRGRRGERCFALLLFAGIGMRLGSGILRSIAVGIRIVAIRVVVIGRAGIDGVEHDAQQAALHAHQ